jgi:hypothetical protein
MIIILLFLTIAGSILSLVISGEETTNKDFKIKLVTYSEIILALIITGFSLYKDYKSDQQHDRIERLDGLNNTLERKINNLASINNSIARNSQSIELDNKKLAEKNSKLSDTLRLMLSDINKLSNQQYDENSTRGTLVFKFNKQVKTYKDFYFQVGGNIREGAPTIEFLGDPIPLIFAIRSDRLFISGQIIDYERNHLVEINNNEWLVNAHIKDKLNYDNKGFEVIDDRDNVIFSIDILKNNTIKIQGIFLQRDTRLITIIGDKEILSAGNIGNREHDSFNNKFRKLFVYTGRNWLHKRSQ